MVSDLLFCKQGGSLEAKLLGLWAQHTDLPREAVLHTPGSQNIWHWDQTAGQGMAAALSCAVKSCARSPAGLGSAWKE